VIVFVAVIILTTIGREAKGIEFTARSDEEVAEEMQRTA